MKKYINKKNDPNFKNLKKKFTFLIINIFKNKNIIKKGKVYIIIKSYNEN